MRTQVARRARRAFSLLELTLVLAIIGVLMAVAAVNILGTGQRANIKATKASLMTVGRAIESYHLENASTYPPALTSLTQYLDNARVKDAWKTEFWYAPVGDSQGNPFTLSSAGPDKTHGTEDDISYWVVKAE